MSKWKQEDDGMWVRTIDGVEERTSVNPNATEAALAAAQELGVNLNDVKGTGKDGSITKGDVESASK